MQIKHPVKIVINIVADKLNSRGKKRVIMIRKNIISDGTLDNKRNIL